MNLKNIIPASLRNLSKAELELICDEIRSAINGLETDKPAHLQSSLGVVELTVALHHLLNLPKDVLIWDVGHQTAAQKILTGRLEPLKKGLRQWQGASGFPSRDESDFDVFTTGHSASSLSTLAGMAHFSKGKNHVAVIGDGALTGGVALEALNFIGGNQTPCVIVLNDNGKSIDENVGALHQNKNYKNFFNAFSIDFYECESGNDLVNVLDRLKKVIPTQKPIAMRFTTEFGKGFLVRDKVLKPKPHSFQKALSEVLEKAIEQQPDLVLVSPAMIAGAGWSDLKNKFPDRVIDVGIAEQHAVAFSAGLARAGKTVICHLYSTFSQRAVDQIIHDVALQKLPCFFIIDRAGLVGEDGPTHHGLFDVGLLNSAPNLEIWAPAYANEAANLLDEYLKNPNKLISMRIPREVFLEDVGEVISNPEAELMIINFGSLYFELKMALKKLSAEGIDFNFRIENKLLIHDSLMEDCIKANKIVVVEDSPGELGFYSVLNQFLMKNGIHKKVYSISPSKDFHPHGSLSDLRQYLHIDSVAITNRILSFLNI